MQRKVSALSCIDPYRNPKSPSIHAEMVKSKRSFVDLPPEIRNMIYEYAVKPKTERLHWFSGWCCGVEVEPWLDFTGTANILRLNWTIYNESHWMLHSTPYRILLSQDAEEWPAFLRRRCGMLPQREVILEISRTLAWDAALMGMRARPGHAALLYILRHLMQCRNLEKLTLEFDLFPQWFFSPKSWADRWRAEPATFMNAVASVAPFNNFDLDTDVEIVLKLVPGESCSWYEPALEQAALQQVELHHRKLRVENLQKIKEEREGILEIFKEHAPEGERTLWWPADPITRKQRAVQNSAGVRSVGQGEQFPFEALRRGTQKYARSR